MKSKWRIFLLEFLSIFIGVSLAFALEKWNQDRKEFETEDKILLEIKNGLERDLKDIEENIMGHKACIEACYYFRDWMNNQPIGQDTLRRQYFLLLRDFISIQNKTGYESLRSKGLELVRNDSLRYSIISLYDFSFEILEKLEEQYSEMQFNDNYYKEINTLLTPYMVFDENGQFDSLKKANLTAKEKNEFLSYLYRIEDNRKYMLKYYDRIYKEMSKMTTDINKNLTK